MARIQNNIMAMNTHRMYTNNNKAVSKAAEKLSSGFRVNRAGDDAAGLAISEKMRAQIRGLNMAAKNSNDAISLVQTAEGALQEVQNMLQRMNELAVQSASDTNVTLDRDALQLEFAQLQDEIDQIARTTKFNDTVLLDGPQGTAENGTFTDNKELKAAATNQYGAITLEVTAKALEEAVAKAAAKAGIDTTAGAEQATVKVTADATDVKIIASIAGQDLEVATGALVGSHATDTQEIDLGALGKITIAPDAGGQVGAAAIGTAINDVALGTVDVTVSGGDGFVIQVGAEEGHTLDLQIDPMNTEGLAVTKEQANIKTRDDASKAITTVRNAINTVSTQRATLGAMQNRLEYKVNNLATTVENLQAAESQIRDVDMAKEMSNFTKNNILVQASTAMLAQANSLPQNVLQLLG